MPQRSITIPLGNKSRVYEVQVPPPPAPVGVSGGGPYSFGVPHRRTRWTVASVALNFTAEARELMEEFEPITVPEWKLLLAVRLTVGSKPVEVVLIPFTIPKWEEPKAEPESTESSVKFSEKQYVLELFTPVEVGGGEDFSIELELNYENKPKLASNNFTLIFFARSLTATAILNQEFHHAA